MRSLALMTIILLASFSLSACGGSSAKVEDEPVPTGSLMRIFKLMDDQGRESGTLVINPLGGAELKDTDGKVIGLFAPATSAPQAATEPAAEKPEPKE